MTTKTKTKHTAGPWTYRETADTFKIGHPVFGVGPKIDGAVWFVAENVDEADARLIAAAPELLKTLEYILDIAHENSKGIDGYEQIIEWAQKAIAKAEGK